MEDCGMCDLGFNGYPFTWCNGRGRRNRISERLDRVMINEGWSDLFHSNRVDHKGKTGSDHSLMIFKAGNDSAEFTRYFRFLNFWTSQSSYLSTVEEIWNIDVQGNYLWVLQQKLKAISKGLRKWSKDTIGDIFETIKKLETDICRLEEIYDANDTDNNRQTLMKAHAEYTRWLIIQKSIFKQKARIKWAEEGDANTKYFYSVVKEKRRKAHIHKIKDANG
ncbi:uncharacterized protein [Nicotiana tomentosiformis]|uniref:uncharacterized protein n=1 Tax=Nicotiana tomentosiformis TaxID=4098 RepID=UPI00051B9EE7|nr:uncharacterized protein LOC104085229 [Nicotiana tomentosiformis]